MCCRRCACRRMIRKPPCRRRIEDGLRAGVDDLDHEVDRYGEACGTDPLNLEPNAEQYSKRLEPLLVVVGEVVDLLEEGAQCFGIAVRQIGVLEDLRKSWEGAFFSTAPASL